MYRVAICDDENIIRDDLCRICTEVLDLKGIEYSITPYNSGTALDDAIGSGGNFDLIILDIELKDKNGIAIAQEMRKKNDMTSIIFVSSHEIYLKDGYSIQPIHFLVKPVDFNMMYTAISADLRINHSSTQLLLSFKNKSHTINTNDIIYIEIMGHNLYIHTDKGKAAFRQTMTGIEQMLPGEFFCRCHNSYIVNLRYIDEFTKSEIYLNNGTVLPIGRKYCDSFQHKFIRYMNSLG